MMPSQPHRRFVLADAMLLIVATAVGIALVRAILHDILAILPTLSLITNPLIRANNMMRVALLAGSPLLAAWTVALLLARLGRPRPHLRRVLRQPGAVACAVATLTMAVDTTWIIPTWVRGFSALNVRNTLNVANILVNDIDAGYAVLGGWSALALMAQWCPEPVFIVY